MPKNDASSPSEQAARILPPRRHRPACDWVAQHFRMFPALTLLTAIMWTGEILAQSRHSANTLALDSLAVRPAAAIEDVAWIAGHWRGEAFGGISEEIWSAPSANAMMGMYKSGQTDSVVFYEFLLIVEESNSLELKLKHFHASLSGWEEKDVYLTFPLVKLTPTEAFFAGQTYRRLDENTLQVFVAIQQGDSVHEVEIRYSRVME